jgi:O-antigen/teichoic acid export membrane protein
MAGSGVFLLAQTQLRAQFSARAYAGAGLIYALTSAMVSVAFVAGQGMGLQGIFIGQVAGAIAGLLVAASRLRANVRPVFDLPTLTRMLRFSAPLVVSSAAVFAGTYLDRFAIREFRGLADVGVFGLGFRVASVATIVTIAIQTSLVPLIYARVGDHALGEDLARLLRLYVAASLILIVGSAAFAAPIVAFLAPSGYAGAAVVVPILTAALLANTAYAFLPGLTINLQTRAVAAISIAGGIANAVLLVLLVPRWGIVGASLATLAVAMLVFTANAVMSQRLLPAPHRWVPLATATVFAGSAATLGLMLGTGVMSVLVAIVLSALVIAANVGLGLVTRSDWTAALAGARQLRHRMAR